MSRKMIGAHVPKRMKRHDGNSAKKLAKEFNAAFDRWTNAPDKMHMKPIAKSFNGVK